MDNKQVRLFLALGLSFILLYVYQIYFGPQTPPPQVKGKGQEQQAVGKGQEQKQAQGKGQTDPQGQVKGKGAQPVTPGGASGKGAGVTGKLKVADAEKNNPKQTAALFNDRFYIEFNSEGGRVSRFFLRNFKENDREYDFRKTNRVGPINVDGKIEQALEVTENRGMDLQLFMKKKGLYGPALNKANYRITKQTKDRVHFALSLNLGGKTVELTKKFRIFPGENFIRFAYSIKNLSKESVQFGNSNKRYFLNYLERLGPLNGKIDAEGKERYGTFTSIEAGNFYNFYYRGEELERIASVPADGMMMCGTQTPTFGPPVIDTEGTALYIGSSSRYLITSLTSLNNDVYPQALHQSQPSDYGRLALAMPGQLLAPAGEDGSTFTHRFALYMGLREGAQIQVNNPSYAKNELAGLEPLIAPLKESFDVSSFLAPFRDAIIFVLRILHTFIPNWGVVIIVFAILFKLAFYPLNQKQAESMKKMQAIQPKMQELQKKYADNAQLKNQKMMELYKEHKINPAAGCLPMLIQMPIFIALYGAFGDSPKLWEAGFFNFWITDLSRPDTVATLDLMGRTMNVHLLPILMAGTQILQSKFTPMSGDAAQQKIMMYLMPLMLLFFLWDMPSGLTLYWTITNLLTIVQQVYTNKKLA